VRCPLHILDELSLYKISIVIIAKGRLYNLPWRNGIDTELIHVSTH
jgi:hypothetical protein